MREAMKKVFLISRILFGISVFSLSILFVSCFTSRNIISENEISNKVNKAIEILKSYNYVYDDYEIEQKRNEYDDGYYSQHSMVYRKGNYKVLIFYKTGDTDRRTCFVAFYSCDENFVINRLKENGVTAFTYSKCE
jgi:hypothetical protein